MSQQLDYNQSSYGLQQNTRKKKKSKEGYVALLLVALLIVTIVVAIVMKKPSKKWTEYIKKACYWDGTNWEYTDATGKLVGRDINKRGDPGLDVCKKTCKNIPNGKCTGIEHLPGKYCSMWYRQCDPTIKDWHSGAENTYSYALPTPG